MLLCQTEDTDHFNGLQTVGGVRFLNICGPPCCGVRVDLKDNLAAFDFLLVTHSIKIIPVSIKGYLLEIFLGDLSQLFMRTVELLAYNLGNIFRL